MIERYKDIQPVLHNTVFVHAQADVIGKVKVGENSSIWPKAVIRGDINSISIGKNCSIQDNTTVHISPVDPVVVGDNVTIGHNCVIHGCKIKGDSIIGMGAVLLNGSVIGKNCIIAAGSVITEGKDIPDNSIVMGVPGKVVRKTTKDDKNRIQENWKEYVDLIKQYK